MKKNERLSFLLVDLLVMSDHGRWSFLHIAAKAAFNYHWYALFSTVTFLLLKLTHDMTLSSTVSFCLTIISQWKDSIRKTRRLQLANTALEK